MTPQQKVFAAVAALALLAGIVEIVRRRMLRLEYSWVWIGTGALITVLVFNYGWLEWVTHQIGAVLPTTTLFIFGIMYLLALGIYFSVRLTALRAEFKNLNQEVALLRHDLEETRDALPRPPPTP